MAPFKNKLIENVASWRKLFREKVQLGGLKPFGVLQKDNSTQVSQILTKRNTKRQKSYKQK